MLLIIILIAPTETLVPVGN